MCLKIITNTITIANKKKENGASFSFECQATLARVTSLRFAFNFISCVSDIAAVFSWIETFIIIDTTLHDHA